MSAATSRGSLAAVASFVALLPAIPAVAQTLKIVPGVSVSESYSDNVERSPSGETRSGWITNVSPILRVDLSGARAKGFLDFRYDDLRYRGEPQLDNSQKTLNSRLTLEAVERWLFIDARAETSQQNRSPFLAASDPASPSVNPNRIEASLYQLAPVIRGRAGETVQYAVRYTASMLRTDDVLVPDSRSGEFSARLQSGAPGRRLNWIVEASDLAIRNDVVGRQGDSRVRATLVYEIVPSLQLSAGEGYERTDFGATQDESRTSPAVGLTWVPSERTQVAALAERRFFGTGHSVTLVHRTPQTSWRLASVRDSSVLPLGISASGTGSIDGLLSYLLTTAIPDPERREVAVRKRLEEFGVARSSLISSGVVTSSPSVYRNTTAGVTIQGVRHFLTVNLTAREERFLDPDLGSVRRPGDNRQRGYSASLSRRLTPETTLSVFGSALRTDGLGEGAADARQGDYGLALSSRFGRNLTVGCGARRTKFNSTLPNASFREGSFFITVSVRS